MKWLWIAIVLISSLGNSEEAYAQLRKLPAEVTNAFKAKFPDAVNVEWQDKLSGFEASFKVGEQSFEARFNNKGEWQETEKKLTSEDLPADVRDGFNKSKYTSWELKESSYLEKKDSIVYKVLVRKNELEKKYLYFDETGKLLKEQVTF